MKGSLRSAIMLVFVSLQAAGCLESAQAPPPAGDREVAVSAQALCPTGPAFPSCFGNCGHLTCSPIDPGACCACDDGCVARGDCCCDFPTYCAPPGTTCESASSGTCAGSCGSQAPDGCWCDTACTGFGDCCADYVSQCRAVDPDTSCVGHCDGPTPSGCWCDTACTGFGDCCDDYTATCACPGAVPLEEADERVQAIAIGAAGEVFVAGTRAPPSGFASDQSDGFLRRVDPVTFATLWDRPIDGCFWDTINDVVVLPGGDVAVAGAMRDGPFSSTPTRLLVRRYSSDGHLVWEATPVTALGEVVGHAIAADPEDGSVVVTGAVTSATEMLPLFARLDGLGTLLALSALDSEVPSVGRGIAVACGGDIAVVTADSGTPARVLALHGDGSLNWAATDVADSDGVDVAFTSTGDLYTVSTVPGGGSTLGSLSRFTSTGALAFQHTIDLTSRHYNPVGGLTVTASDEAVVGGAAATPIGVLEPFVQVVSDSGGVLATHIHSGTTVTGVSDIASGGARALLSARVRPSGPLTQTLIVEQSL